MNFPIYTNLFWDIGFSKNVITKGHYIAKENMVQIDLKINYILLAMLYDVKKQEWFSFEEGGMIENSDSFQLIIPKKGDFILRIGALDLQEGSFTMYEEVAYFTITNK